MQLRIALGLALTDHQGDLKEAPVLVAEVQDLSRNRDVLLPCEALSVRPACRAMGQSDFEAHPIGEHY